MEALKLHVLAAALELELERSLGEALPLFAMALFSRPDSADARLLAANYLDPVGDSAVLERVRFGLALHGVVDHDVVSESMRRFFCFRRISFLLTDY